MPSQLRILFVIDSLGGGGAEYSSALFWYFLQQKGFDFKVIVWAHRAEGVEQQVLSHGINVEFLSRAAVIKNARQLADRIKQYQPDLVHSTLFFSNIRARVAKLFTKFVHVESLVNHMYDASRLNDPNVNWIKLNGYRWLDKATQSVAVDRFHANGESVKNHYIKELGISPHRIEVVNRGRPVPDKIDRETTRSKLLSEWGISPEASIIIHVARQEYQKGHDILIKSLNFLLQPEKTALVMVGREGNYTQQINQLLDAEQPKVRVVQLGHRSDVAVLLQVADIFVFPSRFEGFPGVLIEAEAAALPIVCSDIPMNREVVEPDQNALLFPSENVMGLAGRLNELLQDRNKRVEFGKKSAAIFNDRFEMDSIHHKMLDFYARTVT